MRPNVEFITHFALIHFRLNLKVVRDTFKAFKGLWGKRRKAERPEVSLTNRVKKIFNGVKGGRCPQQVQTAATEQEQEVVTRRTTSNRKQRGSGRCDLEVDTE